MNPRVGYRMPAIVTRVQGKIPCGPTSAYGRETG